MPFPTGWPPRTASGRRSVRVYIEGTATANFSDNAYLFKDLATAKTIKPTPYVAPGDETANVAIGDLTGGGTPFGGGVQFPNVGVPGDAAPANVPTPQLFAQTIRVINDSGNDLEFSFDGTNVHGKLLAADLEQVFRNRFESGIAVRGSGAFRVEAW